MATTSLWKVESRIDHVVDYATDKDKTKNKYYNQFNNFSSVRDLLSYATNPDKTEKQFFTTGINCKVEDAVKQMELVKILYGKEDGILAFHGYQSFDKGEVTPEIAHEIGVRLAEEMWGDRFQIVVSTHLNTEHIHNHFVVNSVSFKDGLKYYSDLSNTALLRKTSDDLCDEYGLRVLEEKTCKSGINFENFYKKSIRDSDYYKFAKEDLDYAIKHSYTQKEFHQYLSSMGYSYYYRANKLCIRREPYKRNIRVERAFGEEYSVENIRQRIIANDFIPKEKIIPYKITTLKFYGRKNIFRKAYKPKGIIALYYYYRFLLGLTLDRDILYERINHRVDIMRDLGLEDEVKKLYQKGLKRTHQSMKAIGYKEWFDYFEGHISQDEVYENIKKHSRQYAKRQYTWFKNQFDVHWYEVNLEDFNKTVQKVLKDIQ